MTKISKPFTFTYTLKKFEVRHLSIKTETLDITITGQAYRKTGPDPFYEAEMQEMYDRHKEAVDKSEYLQQLFQDCSMRIDYSADIETIIWNGQDVKLLLEFAYDKFDEIEQAANAHAEKLFTDKNQEAA